MSLWRNVVWFAKGFSEYTRSGYVSASKHFNAEDLDVDCSGKVVLITGANSGIGKQTALEVAKRKGVVHMVCRNPEYAEEAKKEVIAQTGNDMVHVHILDLSKTKDVIAFARKFSQDEAKLDVLVNNAGCMVNTRTLTDDNLEKNFATNTLGTYAITKGLEEVLQKSHDPRVITVSSGGMLVQKLDTTDLQFEQMTPFDGTMAYAQNKRQQIVMTEKWAAANESIKYYVMHPGWADTPAVQNSMPDFHRKMEGKLRTVEQGADTVVWLAVSETAGKSKTGLFWQDRKAVSTHLPLAWTRSSQGDEDSLMETLQKMTEEFKSKL